MIKKYIITSYRKSANVTSNEWKEKVKRKINVEKIKWDLKWNCKQHIEEPFWTI